MLPSEIIEMIGEAPDTFWRIMLRLVKEKLPPEPRPITVKPKIEPMDYNAAKAFEKVRISFGVHTGKQIGDLPCDYLLYLVEGNEFTKQVKAYVKSSVFARRQEE